MVFWSGHVRTLLGMPSVSPRPMQRRDDCAARPNTLEFVGMHIGREVAISLQVLHPVQCGAARGGQESYSVVLARRPGKAAINGGDIGAPVHNKSFHCDRNAAACSNNNPNALPFLHIARSGESFCWLTRAAGSGCYGVSVALGSSRNWPMHLCMWVVCVCSRLRPRATSGLCSIFLAAWV